MKILKIIKNIVVYSILIIVILNIIKLLIPAKLANGMAISAIENNIKRTYPNHTITDLKLEYTDWSSTLSEAKDDDKATRAEVIIENDDESRTLRYEKKLFFWIKKFDGPDRGTGIIDGEYYAKIEYEFPENIHEYDYAIENGYTILIRNDDGEFFSKSKNGNYYSVLVCKKLYKTENHKVYEYNRNSNKWEESKEKYSDLLYYIGNYKKIDKQRVDETISKYNEINNKR